MPLVRRLPLLVLILVSSWGSTGCKWAGEGDRELGARPYVPLPDPEPQSIGFFLAQYAKTLKQWHQLKLTAKSDQDLRRLHAMERSLQKRSAERFDELLVVLVEGAPVNRQTSAMAIGFSGSPRALSPLLDALSDSNGGVVQNALTGLGLLADPQTPTRVLASLLVNHPDPWTRNNAAFALQCIVSSRAEAVPDEELAEECRDALIDEEPGVRAQCASVLGILKDPKAVQPLADLLYDDVNLVSAAAATSLSHIARSSPRDKGTIVRELVQALEKLDPDRRPSVLRELCLLRDANLGENPEDWREWAWNLP